MDWLEFAETWSIVIFTYLLTSVFFLFIVWGYNGFNALWTELDMLLVSVQLIGALFLILIPLLVYGLSHFKVVRRD